MGIMLAAFVFGFLFLDFMADRKNKELLKRIGISTAVFSVGFLFALYISWPYLWKHPIGNFVESFTVLAHYKYDAQVLFGGSNVPTINLPWIYFPTWFLISNPVLWLVAGCAGLVALTLEILKKPSLYIKNTPERNLLLYLLCFWVPIVMVIGMNSVIYDDWRHLYFVYPPFILIAVYFVNRVVLRLKGNLKYAVYGVCGLQIALVALFMVQNHPFHQVYFNELVSHEPEYLRENYELEYWGAGFKQGLDHILSVDTSKTINIACNYSDPCKNNIMMLNAQDRNRFNIIPVSQIGKADYFITNFRGHPEDYPSKNIEYSVKVLNSTILCVYKLKK
jgi:hypothetical protein